MSAAGDRILVVDDDENILFLLTRALERGGFRVHSTSESLQALDLLNAGQTFAVLLTDLMMPGLSGMELLRRAREIDPYLEIIVITAAGSVDTAIAALRDGRAWDYLLKPLDSFQQVNVVVQRAVAHRALALERAALQAQAAGEAERLRLLVDSVGEAILAGSSQGIIRVANPAALRLLLRADLVGKAAADVLPARLQELLDGWQVVGPQFPAVLEMPWNATADVMVSLTRLPEPGGGDGWVMALREITTARQQEKLKAQALAEVVGRIRLLLAEAMNALVEINLRAPKDERLADSLFRLTRAWENIQSWGDELLAAAQTETARAPQPAEIDLPGMLRSLADEPAVNRFQNSGGKLVVRAEGELPALQTDPDQLLAVLRGLARRAALRGQPGGQVEISARLAGQNVWIEIRDPGPAAEDADLLGSIDTPLPRLVAEPAAAAANLELARARAILDRLDGRLWIGGSGPRGSAVHICLPVSLNLASTKR